MGFSEIFSMGLTETHEYMDVEEKLRGNERVAEICAVLRYNTYKILPFSLFYRKGISVAL